MARSGEHYIPRPDGNFSAWANHYYEAVKKFYDAQGFDPTDLKPLETALENWNKDYPAHVAAQQRAEGARQAKDAARAALEKEVRPVTNFVQGWPKTTNADRAEMGITVRDTSPSPAPAPSSRPLALVESGQRLTHQLRLVDESTPTRRARPAGVLGAEVWVKLVEPGTGHQALGTGEGNGLGVSSSPVPSAQSQVPGFSFLTMTTRPSFRAEFKAGEGGKWGGRRLHGPLGQHTRRKRPVVGGDHSHCGGLTSPILPLVVAPTPLAFRVRCPLGCYAPYPPTETPDDRSRQSNDQSSVARRAQVGRHQAVLPHQTRCRLPR